MRSRRRLSVSQFVKRHPDLGILTVESEGSGPCSAEAYLPKSGRIVAKREGTNLGRVVYELSEACYKLAGLEAMDRQDWKSASTGEVGKPLQRHHVKPRSKGRNDSAANLSAVTAEVHAHQHEGRGNEPG